MYISLYSSGIPYSSSVQNGVLSLKRERVSRWARLSQFPKTVLESKSFYWRFFSDARLDVLLFTRVDVFCDPSQHRSTRVWNVFVSSNEIVEEINPRTTRQKDLVCYQEECKDLGVKKIATVVLPPTHMQVHRCYFPYYFQHQLHLFQNRLLPRHFLQRYPPHSICFSLPFCSDL